MVAGNVVTADGVADLVAAGADIVKVGVGPGAMCTTRMMTGVGRPQFSAVLECAAAARGTGRARLGRRRRPLPARRRAGARGGRGGVMVGSWFAGTYESPGDCTRPDGTLYKESFGMASARAVRGPHRGGLGVRPGAQGACSRRASPRRGCTSTRTGPGVEDLLDMIVAGVRSSCTYAGRRDLDSFAERAVVGIQSAAGYAEGMPVPTSW